MLTDRYGLGVTTSSADACAAYVDATDRMLASIGGVDESLDAALDADPEFALAHAARARQLQFSGRISEAGEAIETASRLAETATTRERRHVEIMRLLTVGDAEAALSITREHLAEHPRDAFVLAPSASVFGTIGFSGRVGREAEQLEFVEPLAKHYGDDWWFHSIHAFALLETGRWEQGRQLAERSLELRPDSAAGAHTLAHALYEGGADEDATRYLADWLPGLGDDALLYCHVWWHYALLLLSAGCVDEAWDTVEEHCLPGRSASPSINVFTDATSFLWRAELAGAPCDRERWEAVRDFGQEQFPRPIVFVDAHVGLAHAALGDAPALAACVDQLQQLDDDGRLPAGPVAGQLTRAYGAFAAEDWATTIQLLEPVVDQVVRIGGSRAQRDLVANTLIAAYVNDERIDDAVALIGRADGRRPSRPVAGLAAA